VVVRLGRRLKTPCQLSLVVRQEGDTLRRYSQSAPELPPDDGPAWLRTWVCLTADRRSAATLLDLFNLAFR